VRAVHDAARIVEIGEIGAIRQQKHLRGMTKR
jgi:hypothetical protein